MTTEVRNEHCGYKFTRSTNYCGAPRSHPVHRKGDGQGGSRWHGPEEYHTFDHRHEFKCECGAIPA